MTTGLELPPDAFALQATIVGCEAELRLNDVPLVIASIERIQSSGHATPWIVAGENELRLVVARTLRVESLPTGTVAVDREAGPVFAAARVLAGRYEDVVPDPRRDATLAELSFAPSDGAPPPTMVVARFQVASRPRWAWQDARVLDPEKGGERAAVLALVREIHTAFVRGDAAAMLARMPTLIAESPLFGAPDPATFAAELGGELTRSSSEPGYAVRDFEDDDVVLRPIAGGRVLRVLDRSGRPLLRSAPGASEVWAFRLDVAMIQGRLELARIA